MISTVAEQARDVSLGRPAVVLTPCAFQSEIAHALRAGSCEAVDIVVDPAEIEALDANLARPLAIIMAAPATASIAAASQLAERPRTGLWYAARCLAAATRLARAVAAPILTDPEFGDDPVSGLRRVLCDLQLPAPAKGSLCDSALLEAVRGARPTPPNPLDLYARGLPRAGSIGWWDAEHFWWGDDHAAPLPQRVDVTGAARTLIFGPLTALPPGRWRLTARFGLCSDAARSSYILYFGGGGELARLDIRPTGPGDYEVAIESRWDDIGVADFRLALMRPAFHGELRFYGAQIEALD